jgi:hypothetical protein
MERGEEEEGDERGSPPKTNRRARASAPHTAPTQLVDPLRSHNTNNTHTTSSEHRARAHTLPLPHHQSVSPNASSIDLSAAPSSTSVRTRARRGGALGAPSTVADPSPHAHAQRETGAFLPLPFLLPQERSTKTTRMAEPRLSMSLDQLIAESKKAQKGTEATKAGPKSKQLREQKAAAKKKKKPAGGAAAAPAQAPAGANGGGAGGGGAALAKKKKKKKAGAGGGGGGAGAGGAAPMEGVRTGGVIKIAGLSKSARRRAKKSVGVGVGGVAAKPAAAGAAGKKKKKGAAGGQPQPQQQPKANKQQQQGKPRAPAGAFAGVPLVRGADGRLYQPVPTTSGPGGGAGAAGGGGGARQGGGRGRASKGPPPMPGYGMMPPPGFGGYGMMPPPGYGMMPPPHHGPPPPHHQQAPPAAGRGPAPASGGGPAIIVSSKLFVSNLDPNVTESDVRELFLTCGPLREYGVHFDKAGRSQGTAHVVFERAADAAAAVRRYHGVALDGRKMRIEVVEGGGLGGRLS